MLGVAPFKDEDVETGGSPRVSMGRYATPDCSGIDCAVSFTCIAMSSGLQSARRLEDVWSVNHSPSDQLATLITTPALAGYSCRRDCLRTEDIERCLTYNGSFVRGSAQPERAR